MRRIVELAAWLALCLIPAPHVLWAAEQAQPNILVIFADDVPAGDFGCYGNSIVRTPNIDRLAGQGMRFANMFTTSASCVPSRVSLYTGLYPIRHGAHPNWSSAKPGTKSLPHYLSQLGYRVILLGKTHILPAESFSFEHYPDVNPIGSGPDFERILAQKDDRPWCIVMAKFSAHVPWPHNKFNYDPQTIDIPDDHIDTPEARQMRAKYYSKITEMDVAVGNVLDALRSSGLENDTLTVYTADHGTDWPKQKWNVYDAGLKTPFIVRWPGRIRAGAVTDALASYVDLVPTLIEVAGGDVADTVARAGSQPLDGRSFLPVLTGNRAEQHDAVYGCFTWGVMTAYPMRAVRTRTHKYIWNIDAQYRYNWPPDTGWWGEADAPMAWTRYSLKMWPLWQSWLDKAETDPAAARILRQIQFRPEEELYDLHADPLETVNLADRPDQQELKASLRGMLDEWMQQQGDHGDSAYHKESGHWPTFLNQFYSRQHTVNVRTASAGFTDASVQLVCPLWQAAIHYTIDGTEPTRQSTHFTKPFTVTPPVTIKARAYFGDIQTEVKVVDLPETDFRFHYQYHLKPWSW